MNPQVRVIAFYLPQYHPIPENDEWWGKGFTEWTNVAKARPLFRGHYQPKVPADLGFYDLRVPETRRQQADLARQYGVEAFCYYHYWFAGKQLLERPFDDVLRSGEPDFPFCICWANQTWTGIWHGAPNRILIEQTYPGDQDHIAHFRALEPAFHDPRYVRVDGKPLFLIYVARDFPDPKRTTDLWRELAVRSGLPGLHLVGLNSPPDWVPQEHGYDASVVSRSLGELRNRGRRDWSKASEHPFKWLAWKMHSLRGRPAIYPYSEVAKTWILDNIPGIEMYPCVLPNWDNTPRSRQNGLVLSGSTPELFRPMVQKAIANVLDKPRDRRLVFLKSWNEWAEGNYVEPDFKYGHGFLQVLLDEIRNTPARNPNQELCHAAEVVK